MLHVLVKCPSLYPFVFVITQRIRHPWQQTHQHTYVVHEGNLSTPYSVRCSQSETTGEKPVNDLASIQGPDPYTFERRGK
ncbi:hypothetical protein PDIG_43740 [Penicillium digitatum PHI26]|uniref:Uncharacterized protein n=2 Tax=Penicillium digitatum TaxID=36651 RepID=K9FS05_PEND2|nr:hypothetical protein PDIP_34970 [Penicillium digitatum Pd1]EKV12450.1 hypothetical protein PDIG_43740 [Penicillium digitatum PHI26]EKV16514.1 hypothetical protein PDIP_34970 [Penicillium digitatum Pd1]